MAPVKTSKALVSAVNDDDLGTYSDSGAYNSDDSENIRAELDLDWTKEGGPTYDTEFSRVWKANVAAGLWK